MRISADQKTIYLDDGDTAIVMSKNDEIWHTLGADFISEAFTAAEEKTGVRVPARVIATVGVMSILTSPAARDELIKSVLEDGKFFIQAPEPKKGLN